MFQVEEPMSPKVRQVLTLCSEVLNIIPNPILRLQSKRMLIQRLQELGEEQLDKLLWLNRGITMRDISMQFKDDVTAALAS